MRKHIIGALTASALAVCGTAHAGLTLDLNGSAAGGQITADGLDWAPTSFLAQGGNTAIAAFTSQTGCPTGGCTFNVLTQAVLTGYKPTGGSTFVGLPNVPGNGQITLVASYQERVTGFTPGTSPLATFTSTGVGMVEFYYNPAGNASDLTGFGFKAGTLIGRLSGVTNGAAGLFSITDPTPVALDAAPPAPDQYTGQTTVTGIGTQATLMAGSGGVVLDPTFFLSAITGFSLNFTNISIGLPYTTVKPADCFNTTETAVAVGTTGISSQCNNNHTNGTYAQQTNGGGYLPVVGAVNGLNLGSPDFVAQTDFNSAVTGGTTVPEPGTLALVGLALGSMGFVAKRRRG